MTGKGARAEPGRPDELQPVMDALLVAARKSAGRVQQEAREQASALMHTARVEADRILADARAQGAAQARTAVAVETAQARRQARASVLRAQQAAYDQLLERSRSAARQLIQDPVYAAEMERLAGCFRRQLGERTRVATAAGGGLIAETSTRRIDASVDALVERVLEELGEQIPGLWAP